LSEPLLRLESVDAGYGDAQVLRHISLEVTPRSVVGILGPNGHGKTTLLKAISGLIPTTAGVISFDGARIDGWRPDQVVGAGLIHIPQGDLIFPGMTVRENLLLGAYLPNANRRKHSQLQQVLRIFPRLQDRIDQIASTLSGGERRMLALGRGLMSEAKMLMVDEPSLGLAPLVTENIYQTLAVLKEHGVTILLVEESPERLVDLADHVHLIDHGAVVWEGSTQTLMSHGRIVETYLGA
jgi:branched-chain amino acid transport system ATP-binding protein